MSTVYLLHFAQPLGNLSNPRAQAAHYIGWALNLEDRIRAHRAGRGSHLTRIAVERGITFEVVATWPGDRNLERQIKGLKSSPRLCPICGRAHPRGPLCLSYTQLSLDLEEWPAPPATRCDWYEWSWRQACIRPTSYGLPSLDTSSCDIPW
jgi:hypothetical protein